MTDRQQIIEMFTRAGLSPRQTMNEVLLYSGSNEISLSFDHRGSLNGWGCHVDEPIYG